MEQKNKHAVALGLLGGKKGGLARAERLSPERRSEIARNAAIKRWSDIRTYQEFKSETAEPFQKSGMEDDPDWELQNCQDRSHNPPGHLYIPPGKQYRHVCPSCGFSVVIKGWRVRL